MMHSNYEPRKTLPIRRSTPDLTKTITKKRSSPTMVDGLEQEAEGVLYASLSFSVCNSRSRFLETASTLQFAK